MSFGPPAKQYSTVAFFPTVLHAARLHLVLLGWVRQSWLGNENQAHNLDSYCLVKFFFGFINPLNMYNNPQNNK